MKFPARQRVIAAAIAQAREDAGLSQRSLSAKLGDDVTLIHLIEKLRRDVSVAELIAIEKALGLKAGELYARCVR